MRDLTADIGRATALAYSPDGARLAAGGGGGIFVWESGTGVPVGESLPACEGVTGLSYSPDGALLAAAHRDGVVRIWNAADAELLASLVSVDADGWATLLPDGSYKAGGDCGEMLWWAGKMCRFDIGELDGVHPDVRRLDPGSPVPGLERHSRRAGGATTGSSASAPGVRRADLSAPGS